MYQFKITAEDDGGYRFELNGIKLLVDAYTLKDEKHWINTPKKAIAFFNIGEDIYGVSNEPVTYNTVEDFYDIMLQQYGIFQTTKYGNHVPAGKDN